jgi:hypothetical protein
MTRRGASQAGAEPAYLQSPARCTAAKQTGKGDGSWPLGAPGVETTDRDRPPAVGGAQLPAALQLPLADELPRSLPGFVNNLLPLRTRRGNMTSRTGPQVRSFTASAEHIIISYSDR